MARKSRGKPGTVLVIFSDIHCAYMTKAQVEQALANTKANAVSGLISSAKKDELCERYTTALAKFG